MIASRAALLATLILSLPACDEDEPPVDGAVSNDMSGSVDAGPDLAGTDGSPGVLPLSISATGHDRLLGVTYGPDGSIYAVGYRTDDTAATADFSTVVVKFTADGAVDSNFGQSGYFTKNVVVGKGGEVARGIVVQSSGKIVVSMTLEHAGATDERDRDTALMRINADGTLDTGFGNMGVYIHDLSDGAVITGGYVADGT